MTKITIDRAIVEQEPVGRTDQQIVDQTEELAVWLLHWAFSRQPETPTPMRESRHPMAERCWAAACHIQEMLTATDPENAVSELDGEAPKDTSNESAYQRGYMDGMARQQSKSEGLAEAQVVYQISLKNGAASSAWVDVDEAAYNSAKLYGEFDCRCLYTLPPKGEQTVPSDCPHSHQQEPVLVVEKEPDYWSRGHFYQGSKPHIDHTKVRNLSIGTKLYTAPPQRKPLTDEQINELELPLSGTGTVRDLVRVIEQAHGIEANNG